MNIKLASFDEPGFYSAFLIDEFDTPEAALGRIGVSAREMPEVVTFGQLSRPFVVMLPIDSEASGDSCTLVTEDDGARCRLWYALTYCMTRNRDDAVSIMDEFSARRAGTWAVIEYFPPSKSKQ